MSTVTMEKAQDWDGPDSGALLEGGGAGKPNRTICQKNTFPAAGRTEIQMDTLIQWLYIQEYVHYQH